MDSLSDGDTLDVNWGKAEYYTQSEKPFNCKNMPVTSDYVSKSNIFLCIPKAYRMLGYYISGYRLGYITKLGEFGLEYFIIRFVC